MSSTATLIREATSLPVEERVRVVDSLLRTLNAPNSETDRQWGAVANRRLPELRSGTVQPVSGDAVFEKISHPVQC